ncbi:hypothetical protein BKA61DRAFT_335515 [Leptodontidium sp. MPI-SDFR-AT-0119]|nr:hypothetical protein BKA61DRAFT_335515 [Leptodontidium sp. MPI-SDFR-AT-0119]
MTVPLNPPQFPRFTSLPPEIRIMIWRLNLPKERDVRVHYSTQIGRFHSTTRPPANLEVCRESRLEASKWQAHFGTLGHPAQVRVNFAIDHIQLDFDPIRLKAVPASALHNIRWLELGGTDLQRMHADSVLAHLLSFRSLEHLTIVSPPPEQLCARYHRGEALAGRSIGERHGMPDKVRAELMGYQERRYMAFWQHSSLATAMWELKDVSRRWKKPRLWLVILTVTGERVGPYEWKLTGLPGYHAQLELLSERGNSKQLL